MYFRLEDVGNENKLDNLFNSVNLAFRAYSLLQKVKIHRVIRNSGCGVHVCVLQEEVTGKKANPRRGIVKVALLKSERRQQIIRLDCCVLL